MIIEIGEKIAPEKGDRGDIGYPGIWTNSLNSSCNMTCMNKQKNNRKILGMQGEDGLLGDVGLPGQPGTTGEKGETGLDGFSVRKIEISSF